MAFEIENGVLLKHLGNETEVTIPVEVTKIEDDAFADSKQIKTLIFTNKNIFFREAAFENLSQLENVYFADGTQIFSEAFPYEIANKINFYLTLAPNENVYVPHQFISSVLDYVDDDEFSININSLISNFSRIKNKREKLAFAKSIVENTNVDNKKVFANYINRTADGKMTLDTKSEKHLINAVVKGEKAIIEDIVDSLHGAITDENDNGAFVEAYIDFPCLEFTNILKLPFFKYKNIKCVLWVEETTENGDNIAIYKKYGEKTKYSYQAFCSNETFYKEEVADDFSPTYLNKDFSLEYVDYSDGIEQSVAYHFEHETDWYSDECFDA